MSLYNLPVQNDRSGRPFSYTVELDGENYNFFVEYNRRIDTWFMTIATQNGVAVIEQMPLLLNVVPMVRLFSDVRLLEWGDIQVIDRNGDNVDPSIFNFGLSKLFSYMSES